MNPDIRQLMNDIQRLQHRTDARYEELLAKIDQLEAMVKGMEAQVLESTPTTAEKPDKVT